MKFVDSAIYAVDLEGGLVAGRVRWDPATRTLSWFNPGSRQRAYEVRTVLEDSDDRLVFLDHVGRRFEMFVLTVEHYNAHVRREQDPVLTTEEELLEAFERSQA